MNHDRSRRRHHAAAAAVAAAALAGCARSPSVLATHGAFADRLAPLGWYLLIVACAVSLLIIVLVLVAALRRHRAEPEPGPARPSGLGWILYGGLLMPAVVLAGTFVFVLITLGATATPPRHAALTVQVIGHRWWWEVRYVGSEPGQRTISANELHLPVGQPVRLELRSADVIHSFWIPELAGKTDLIPGQTNISWIEADQPGVYHGQCGEYCGVQHAHMQMLVVAQNPDQFLAWLDRERQSATPPDNPAAQAGYRAFVGGPCALCHTIRGTEAQGRLGPDLTHLAGRRTIAAGSLPNTRGNLAGWIANSQAIKPGNMMPALYLKPTDLQAIVTYLQTLK